MTIIPEPVVASSRRILRRIREGSFPRSRETHINLDARQGYYGVTTTSGSHNAVLSECQGNRKSEILDYIAIETYSSLYQIHIIRSYYVSFHVASRLGSRNRRTSKAPLETKLRAPAYSLAPSDTCENHCSQIVIINLLLTSIALL